METTQLIYDEAQDQFVEQQENSSPFILGNTQEIELQSLQDDYLIPIFSRENTYKLRYSHYDGGLSPDCINKIYPKDVKIMLNMDDEEVEKLYYPVRTDFNRAYIHYETFMEAFQRRSREAGATEARYISIAVEQYSIELTLYFEPLY